MRHIDSTAQSIDALVQIGALDAARDLLRAELGPLSTHVGAARVEAWCVALHLTRLLELPKAIAAAHDRREMHGTTAIPEFMAIAQTALAQGDAVAEYRALAGVYCTGLLVWGGFGEMQRAFLRINELHTELRDRMSKHEAIECLPGLLVARMLFGGEAAEAALIGEVLVTLVLDETLAATARLRAATTLAPWFEHTRDDTRLHRVAQALLPLVTDEAISFVTRLIYRTSTALADIYLKSGLAVTAGTVFSTGQLMLDVGTSDAHRAIPQWLRFFVYRSAFEQANRGGDQVEAGKILDQLDVLVDPAEGSQVLALHYRRCNRLLRSCEYSASLAIAQRCVDLACALEMPQPIALLYENNVGASLVGLHRLNEARAIYVAIIAKSMPGHRLGYERMCALIDAASVLDQQAVGAAEETLPVVGATNIVREQLTDFLRICGGRLPPNHSQVFPKITQPVVAAIFAHGLGTEVFADDVRAQRLPPPDDHPVSWPWMLRIRLFDGFSIDGINGNTQDVNKRGESKSAQILQYLAAYSPASMMAQRMADALWPEAEGDKAMRSLDVALTRLRHTLPDATLLLRQEGKIGFDLNRVWCDTRAALSLVDTLRSYVGAGANVSAKPTPDTLVQDARDAQSALALLDVYRGPMLPDSREAFARDRSAFFRSQVAGAVQIGLRAAIRLPDQTMSEEIVRKSVAHGLPADVVRSVIADLQARGTDTSRRAAQLSQVFELARA